MYPSLTRVGLAEPGWSTIPSLSGTLLLLVLILGENGIKRDCSLTYVQSQSL